MKKQLMNKLVKLWPSLKLFLIWRLALLVIAFLAMKLLPFTPKFPYWDAILSNLSPHQFIWHWANFDGPHYITIAQKGYVGTGLIQAFFPLYPLFIRWTNKLVNNYLLAGLLVSNLCFILVIHYFRKLTNQEKLKNKSLPLLFLLIFPTSFYFGSLYSESLFLLLTLLAFINIFKKNWFKAAFFAGLASATRLAGIFIAPAILWEYYHSKKQRKKGKANFYFKLLVLIFISLSGFLIFCFYLNQAFGHPFYFAQVQSGFGASRQTDKLILFHQVIWRYLKMILTIKDNNMLLFTVGQEFFLSLFTLGMLTWGIVKKIKPSFLIYALGSFFLPPLTGNLSSMPRYVNLIFPLYLILAQIRNKPVKVLLSFCFTTLLIINTALFLRGFWVS